MNNFSKIAFSSLLATIIAATSASAFPLPILNKKAFHEGSGVKVGIEAKHVKFGNDSENDGMLYGLRIGFQNNFGKSNFGLKLGFFVDYGSVDSNSVTEAGMYLAPKYTFNISNNMNVDVYGGVQGKYVGIESSDGYGFVPYGGIEFAYNNWNVALEYSSGTITFKSADIDEDTLSGIVSYRF